ncbi:MAG: hypothetical protein ACUVX1_10800 [Chloroflexota bacterium]
MRGNRLIQWCWLVIVFGGFLVGGQNGFHLKHFFSAVIAMVLAGLLTSAVFWLTRLGQDVTLGKQPTGTADD